MIPGAFRTWFQTQYDPEAYDAAIQTYRQAIKDILVDELLLYDGHFDDSWLDDAIDAIMALSKPVRRRR